jgi:hypothetical protein
MADRKQAVAFLKKSSAKNFLLWADGRFKHLGLRSRKVFAELFSKSDRLLP